MNTIMFSLLRFFYRLLIATMCVFFGIAIMQNVGADPITGIALMWGSQITVIMTIFYLKIV